MGEAVLHGLYSTFLQIESRLIESLSNLSKSKMIHIADNEGSIALNAFNLKHPDFNKEATELFERWIVQVKIIASEISGDNNS